MVVLVVEVFVVVVRYNRVGFVALWLCGFAALRLCGFVALWLCGFAILWPCCFVALWLRGFVPSIIVLHENLEIPIFSEV